MKHRKSGGTFPWSRETAEWRGPIHGVVGEKRFGYCTSAVLAHGTQLSQATGVVIVKTGHVLLFPVAKLSCLELALLLVLE